MSDDIQSLVKDNLRLAKEIKESTVPICTKLWTTLEERGSDGIMYPCCWFRKYPLGKAKSWQDLLDIWRGDRLTQARSLMLEGKVGGLCDPTCPVLCDRQVNFAKQEFYDYSEAELATFDAVFLANRKTVMESILARRTTVDAMPLRLKMHPSNKCNIRCVMCDLNKTDGIENRWYLDSRLAEFRACLEEMKVFGGEPMFCGVSRELIFGNAGHKQLHTSFITNGTLLSDEVLNKLAALRIGWIDISLDSCVQDTYEKIRRGARHSQTMSNMKRLVAMRDAHTIGKFKIYGDFVIQAANCGEITEFVKYCASSGLIPNFSLVFSSDELGDCAEKVSANIASGLEEASKQDDKEAFLRLKWVERLWPSYLNEIRVAMRRNHFRNKTIVGRSVFGIARGVRRVARRLCNR
jgi:sulfatase maturation enzyme AslB (radical SAM superfamily)